MRTKPARLSAEQVGWELNFEVHEVRALTRLKLLKPLGDPSRNAVKWYARDKILACGTDVGWVNRATNAIYRINRAEGREGKEGDEREATNV